MNQGDRLTLTIEKPAVGGRMIARHDGAVVLVAAAIPGEVVEAQVEKVQRGTAWAVATKVVEASPDRVEPSCEWTCGGSALGHVRYERQLAIKQAILADAFGRLGRIELPEAVPVAPSPVDGYRMRARLHVRKGRVGFFREGTHDLCDAGSTRQLLPATLEVAARLEAVARELPRAALVEIEVSENVDASERACHLELARDGDPSRLAAATRLPGLTGVTAASGRGRTLPLWGEARVTDRLPVPGREPLTLARSARAFFQGNRFLLETLVETVMARVDAGPVLDLYAGVGLFALSAAARGLGPVRAIEGDAEAAADLRANAAPFGRDVHVMQGAVEEAGRRGPAFEPATLIVDPPRTGLSREARDLALGFGAPRVVYVSCDPATLARDARALVDAGYRLAHVEAFDLFPNTAHVETLAVFDR